MIMPQFPESVDLHLEPFQPEWPAFKFLHDFAGGFCGDRRQYDASSLGEQRFCPVQYFMHITAGTADDDHIQRRKAVHGFRCAARLGIIVSSLIESNKLEVDQERVTKYINEMAENYEDPNEVIDYYTNNAQERANIEAVVLEDQVVDHILSQGKVTDTEVSYQDLLASQQQAMM